jgi:hypothetical protein
MLHRFAIPFLAAALTLSAQSLSAQSMDPQRVTLQVDRQESGAWHAFRVHANFSGYLYVMNHGTSGSYQLLFPRSDTGSDNRIEAGKEYVVPAAQGWFAVSGPAGYDTVYWMVSPVELTHNYRPLPPPPATPHLPSTLRPRCDDTVFKARGECLDDSAGVKPVAPGEELPKNLSGIAGSTPREMLFMQDKGGVVLSSPQPLSEPVVYELRLAHH